MKNKKGIALFIFAHILFVNNAFCQVGINTDKPTSTLDINGSTHITKNLLVGGDDNTEGSVGEINQLLVSQGEGLASKWKTIEGSETIIDGKLVLISCLTKIDASGGIILSYPDDVTEPDTYDESYTLQQASSANNGIWHRTINDGSKKNWKEFKEMGFTIPPYNKARRIFITLQLPLQAYWDVNGDNASYWISGAFGVFKTGQTSGTMKNISLVGSMQGVCRGTGISGGNTPQTLVTLMTAIDVPISNTASEYLILGTRRNHSDEFTTSQSLATKLYMGSATPGASANDAVIKHLTMRVDVFEEK